MSGLWATLLLVLLGSHQVAGQGYKASFSSAAAGRPQGSVLVLDVSSLWRKHPTQPQLSTPDAGECQERCSKLTGCTAYAFCKDPAGCGTGCSAHVGKNPGVSAVALESFAAPKRGERDMVPSTYKLPMNSFGPYTPNTATKGCHPSSPDKWAFGTCTLLKAVGANKMVAAAEGAGWVGAWLSTPVPDSCKGLSAAACTACSSSPDAATCLSCMTDKRSLGYIDSIELIADGSAGGSLGSRTLDQCLACAKLTSSGDKAKCKNCVLDRQPCGICVPYPGAQTLLPTPAQGPCMSCVEAKGKRFSGTCMSCASAADPNKCIKCLDSFYPKLTCATSDYNNCYKPDFDNPCATCQKVPGTNYEQCISCFSKPASKVDCESCAVLGSATSQAACFKCSAKNPSANSNNPGGCGLCYAHSSSSALLAQCVDCLTADNTTPEKRQVCSLCSSPGVSNEQSARCFKCLEGKAGNSGCSSCSSAATSGPAFGSCMACRGNSANGPDCRDCESLGSSLAPVARDALRKRCWECVSGSKLVVPANFGSAPLGSCSSCFASSVADTASCVACNTNAAVPSLAKGWCIACSTKPAAEREACVKCLAANKALTSAYDFKAKCKL